MSETTSRVACAGANEAFATMIVQALDGRNGFHILETTSGAYAPFLWPISVEGDPEVAHAEGLAEGFGFVGCSSRNVLVRGRGWNPIEVLPHTIELFDFHGAVELCLEKGVLGVVEGVSVFNEVSCSEAFEHILHSLHLEGGTNNPIQN